MCFGGIIWPCPSALQWSLCDGQLYTLSVEVFFFFFLSKMNTVTCNICSVSLKNKTQWKLHMPLLCSALYWLLETLDWLGSWKNGLSLSFCTAVTHWSLWLLISSFSLNHLWWITVTQHPCVSHGEHKRRGLRDLRWCSLRRAKTNNNIKTSTNLTSM